MGGLKVSNMQNHNHWQGSPLAAESVSCIQWPSGPTGERERHLAGGADPSLQWQRVPGFRNFEGLADPWFSDVADRSAHPPVCVMCEPHGARGQYYRVRAAWFAKEETGIGDWGRQWRRFPKMLHYFNLPVESLSACSYLRGLNWRHCRG